MTDFPEKVFYRRGGSAGWHIRNWDTANKLLSYLGPKVSQFAVFEKPDSSYVQCAGAKRRLTVEARVYNSDGGFVHMVFGRGNLIGNRERIVCDDGPIFVDESQVLQMRHARLIIRPFLEQGVFPEQFEKTDVTDTFTESRDR